MQANLQGRAVVLTRQIVKLIFITMLLSSCATLTPDFEKPELQLTNLSMLPAQGLEQRFRLTFRVTNPNNISFPVDGMNFKLSLRGLQVATGVSDKKFVLEPLSDNTFDVDVSASLFNSGRVILDIMNSKPQALAYEINAKIFTSKGLWGNIPVTRSGVIPFGLTQPQ
ncbi:putative lipoprotein [Paraglaciecola sp. T6c]|uniref:LEA type 2 family protein n=1 Tax=Pseudoalteromonas atlantica (strain T6c / ATCC BAA-1087) TaxID=3042615 RepID=UPI00005C6334|nr:LEA type 2 family protein [Paraglaciecola sp. T6c]ABG42289.1 putative lipoprotein [Paraglaciecola sp. T6c]